MNKISTNNFRLQDFYDKIDIEKLRILLKRETNEIKKLSNKILGRKRKKNILLNNQGHNKNSEDNMMRKIKTNLMEYILNLLNDSLKNKEYKFYRIDKNLMECLKKDFNLRLLNRTIEDIFYNEITSKKYRTPVDAHINREVIDKIILEGREEDTIKILKMTFKDIITEIRTNQLKHIEFFKIIEIKENKIREDNNIKDYIDSLKELFSNYEIWFQKKKGRNRNKKSISKKLVVEYEY